jgi:L-fuconate dehydratase
MVITRVRTLDARFPLPRGVGTDAVHANPVYSYGVTLLETDKNVTGSGLAFTLGAGNKQLCDLIEALGERLVGREIEELMSGFGQESRSMADDPQYRWLGPHKGLVHLALSSITNACYDLWAKARNVPLWRLLLDLEPEKLVATLDLSYVDDVLSTEDAVTMLKSNGASRGERSGVLDAGYPGCDTSVEWTALSDQKMAQKATEAVAKGFGAINLQVGSNDIARDVHRASLLRSRLGDSVLITLGAHQAWNIEQAIAASRALAEMDPYWIAEPTHPDDVLGHALIARSIAPLRVAAGEHVPNRVVFKQLLQADAIHFVQADAVRLGGISEFLTVSLLAKKYAKPVVPHVGDMGQIHQHLVLFNHIALDHELLFLEHVPHLRDRFLHPAIVEEGVYWTPEEPGSSSDLV